ncbi:MAG: ABC transporter permease subunit [Anaerolineales bacterium]|nr:ABC transporter permease subunit [Anaerolineales bacterium]MCX7754406.1 ABC transporter permease subunit [Anaerolineales bacterium]MDW8276520.1 ABC transporter permease subunit [Anaerolineales bacterium]
MNLSLLRLSSKSLWREHPLWNWLGLLPFFAFILFFLLVPSLNLFSGAFVNRSGAFTLENLAVFANPNVIKAYLTSLQVSLITALMGGVFGFFVAYAVTIGNAPRWMRNVILTFSGLAANFGGVPLAFAFIATLGRTGFITALLKGICFSNVAGEAVCPFNPYDYGFSLYSLSGLVLAYTYFQFPLMVLTITPALEGLRKEWREASANLGASEWQYWRDIALPVLTPSLLGATLLLFGNAFGAYATAQALTGGSIPLVTIFIGQQIRGDVLGNPHEGYALALGMVVIMALTIVAYTALQKQSSRWMKS